MFAHAESSLTALSPQEVNSLERLSKHYDIPLEVSPKVHQLFEEFCHYLAEQYMRSPAQIEVRDKYYLLPLTMEALHTFLSENVLEEARHRAMQSYYQHPVHTVWRYFSRPNPWMAPDALYVNRDAQGAWSTFEDYKALIALVWRAASDDTISDWNGCTRDSRIAYLLECLVDIARAHNWDKTRIKTDIQGNPVKDSTGKTIREGYDDLEGDNPSCYSGAKRRLFQALSTHPFYSENAEGVIQTYLCEKTRIWMQQRLTKLSSCELEAYEVYLQKILQGNDVPRELFSALNVSDKTLEGWQASLVALMPEGKELVSSRVTLFFKKEKGRNDFLTHMGDCYLSHYSKRS